MNGLPAWKLFVHGELITTSDAMYGHINRFIKGLIGRRLQTFAIDAASLSTRLTFSNELVLMTSTLGEPQRRFPHWLLRLPNNSSDAWPPVVVGRTQNWK